MTMMMISTTIVEWTPSERWWRELYRLCPRAARDRMLDHLDSCGQLEYVAQPRALVQHLRGLEADWASPRAGNEYSRTVVGETRSISPSLGCLRCAVASSA
jgi:hypothetical protein